MAQKIQFVMVKCGVEEAINRELHLQKMTTYPYYIKSAAPPET